ncbi:MAG: D-2-hydroxyacid dehydrogenase family protein [Nitriliruptor sp.]|nr:MAG: D-2-hydroxyacid dehydrogenase family protein [Nitriliruptor sp.]
MAAGPSVAILDDYQQIAQRTVDWEQAALDVTAFDRHISDVDELVDTLAGFEIVVAMRERTPFPAEVLRRLPDLQLLVTTGARNDAIDVAAAAAAGIVVCGTDSLISPTVELTWGLILAVRRHIVAEDVAIRAGGWQTTIGDGLEGCTLGLLGLGRIGSRVATVAQAFGMRTIAWSQNLTPQRAAGLGVTAVSKPALFAAADIVSVHLRLSARTRGMVGATELRSLGPRGSLVNTSRAGIVDRQALLDALDTGMLGGAGLDVFEQEPLPADDALRSAPATVVTPHLGYVTRQNYEVFFRGALEDIEAFLDGQPIRVLPAP